VDDRGNCTVGIPQPMAFPTLEPYYEEFIALCSKRGMSMSLETTANSKELGIALLTGRQFPLVTKGKEE